MSIGMRITLALGTVAVVALAFTSFERPPAKSSQQGYRGTGMVDVQNPRTLAVKTAAAKLPEAIPPEQAIGQPASAVYSNVKVLADTDAAEFMRLMTAITEWVSPEEGCTFCHAEDNLAADTKYPKVVARRMIEMTRHINADWKAHVAETGVTCYSCHRGQPVPANIWHGAPSQTKGMVGNRAGQNAPARTVGLTSLPNEPFTPFLTQASEIRVVARQALPGTDPQLIPNAEATYGLMMHMSTALGQNCTFCHNSRSFYDWDQSSPQRATAWHGIRMVRDLNTAYLDPLKPVFPPARLGPQGDAPKLNCATCHQGLSKPLAGASMLGDYPELRAAGAKR